LEVLGVLGITGYTIRMSDLEPVDAIWLMTILLTWILPLILKKIIKSEWKLKVSYLYSMFLIILWGMRSISFF
jgi:hypothetical protein